MSSKNLSPDEDDAWEDAFKPGDMMFVDGVSVAPLWVDEHSGNSVLNEILPSEPVLIIYVGNMGYAFSLVKGLLGYININRLRFAPRDHIDEKS